LPTVKALMLTISVCAAIAVTGCGSSNDSSTDSTAAAESTATETTATTAEKTKPTITVPKGAPPTKLVIKELEEGTGAEAKSGDEVSVQYAGVNYKSGEEFDSSWSRNAEPFSFQLGAGMVIPGWDQGVEGMKVGGRRELIIPPNLAYGSAGSPPAIGPNETLVFVIDLLEVN
jgi:peptidylprolyl isomerase